MEIGVVGAGYVGLVTAACLADLGNRVRCFDVDRARIERLRDGHLPFSEPGLDRLVRDGLIGGRLSFHETQEDLRGTDLVIVCVGTLDHAGEWTGELVHRAVVALASDGACPRRIVIRSTLLPGTASSIADVVRSIDPLVAVGVSPEFTREGSAVADFMAPHRLVVGVGPVRSATDAEAPLSAAEASLVTLLERLYAPLRAPILVTDATSAELIKVGSNVFLAAKIAFANEISRLAVAAGGDPYAVVDGIGLDKRIGRSFLSPGPGFGGSCLPSQARALPSFANLVGESSPLLAGIARSNAEQTDWVIAQAEAAHGRPLGTARVTVLGLTFKAGTEDLRESPALRLVTSLAARGASVTVHDPVATEAAVRRLRAEEGVEVTPAETVEDACGGADVVIVATEWDVYRLIDWAAIRARARRALVVDARGVVDTTAAEAAGFTVVGLARRAPRTAAQPRPLPEPVARLASVGSASTTAA